jgi:hypothetical protein
MVRALQKGDHSMRSMFLALTILLLPIFLVSHATAEEAEPGYASFARTTIMARYADLGPSITFWRDVMGFSYAGDPKPSTGTSSPLGWDENAVRYLPPLRLRKAPRLLC